MGPRGLCNREYPSEAHLSIKSRERASQQHSFQLSNCFESLPSSVQIFKTIGQMCNKLWPNEIVQCIAIYIENNKPLCIDILKTIFGAVDEPHDGSRLGLSF